MGNRALATLVQPNRKVVGGFAALDRLERTRATGLTEDRESKPHSYAYAFNGRSGKVWHEGGTMTESTRGGGNFGGSIPATPTFRGPGSRILRIGFAFVIFLLLMWRTPSLPR